MVERTFGNGNGKRERVEVYSSWFRIWIERVTRRWYEAQGSPQTERRSVLRRVVSAHLSMHTT